MVALPLDLETRHGQGVPHQEHHHDEVRPQGRREAHPAKPAGSKQATIIEMLRSAEGATIADIVAATGWQSHTVRGAISGALKKRLGFDITSEKVADRGRVYRIDR